MTVAIAWRTGAILARVSGKHEAGLERETRMPSTVALHTHARFELASPRLKNAKKLTPVLQDRAAKMSLKTWICAVLNLIATILPVKLGEFFYISPLPSLLLLLKLPILKRWILLIHWLLPSLVETVLSHYSGAFSKQGMILVTTVHRLLKCSRKCFNFRPLVT